jgi:hypothetical protein
LWVYKIAGFKSLTQKIDNWKKELEYDADRISFNLFDVDRQGFNIPPIVGLIGGIVVVGAAGIAAQTGLFDAINNLISKLHHIIFLCKILWHILYNNFFEFILFIFLYLDPTTTTTAVPIIESKYLITTLGDHKGDSMISSKQLI